MKSIFAIVCSATPSLHNIKFYTTKQLAKVQLKKLANERRYKLGIDMFEEQEDSFSYLMGWEEVKVKFSVIELSVEE